ncbi:phosphonoacetaldehyde reductase [Planctomicrobium sp. SH661]|uniref:phosphonoacetaldehyde reductase n=1 Tax=Planctomicrobium sp. SH661 TaxID=3448124 RepID=UPI003F5BDD19
MTDDRCLDSFNELHHLLNDLRIESLFLVVDRGAYQHSGAREKLVPLLAKRRVTVFDEFEPNPKYPDVLQGIARYRSSGASAVLAIGGGSAIDVAKLISSFSNECCEPLSLILKQSRFENPEIPLIAIPTTAGTGSEATQFAVVYVEGEKHSVDHPKLLPNYCVLDAELTHNLPSAITAQTGLDAFCQAIESIWSVGSTQTSVRDASEAVQLAFEHLVNVVQRPDRTSRAAMLRAAHLAGRAINQTRTTASHAISYTLTSDYGIPHGHAVSLTLGAMLMHNVEVREDDCNDPRGVAHVQESIHKILMLIGCKTPDEGDRSIRQLMESIGCETRLSRLGIQGEIAFRSIADKVNLERLRNNPRHLTHAQLVKILQALT